MSILENLKDLSPRDLELAVLVPVAAIAPGVLAIWHFNPAFFDASSTPKLLFAAIALCSPVVLCSVLVVLLRPLPSFAHALEGDDCFAHALSIGACVASAIGFSVVIGAFIFGATVRQAVWIVLGIQAVFFALSLMRYQKLPKHPTTR